MAMKTFFVVILTVFCVVTIAIIISIVGGWVERHDSKKD